MLDREYLDELEKYIPKKIKELQDESKVRAAAIYNGGRQPKCEEVDELTDFQRRMNVLRRDLATVKSNLRLYEYVENW